MNGKIAVAFVLCFGVTGCNDESDLSKSNQNQGSDNSVLGTNLSGTWLYTKKEDYTARSTGVHLYTKETKYTYIISDNPDSLQYSECWNEGRSTQSGLKTESTFFMRVNETGYTLSDEGALLRSYETQDYENIENIVNVSEKLERISELVLLSEGSVIVNGERVSVNEYEHVCYYISSSTINDSTNLELVVPYEDSSLSLNMSYVGDLTVGTHTYQNGSNEDQIFIFDVTSNSTAFWDAIGSNGLGPSSANIEILQSNDALIQGQFSFVGQDSNQYDGSFSVQMP